MKKILLFTLCAAFVLCIGSLNAQNARKMSGQETSKSTATTFSLQAENDVAKAPTNRAIIFAETFENAVGESLPTGWTSEGTAWFTSSGAVPDCEDQLDAHSGKKCMARSWSASSANNWAFSPGFNLEVGDYEISFWYQAPGYSPFGEHDDFEVLIGTTPTSAEMGSETVVHSNINNDTEPFGAWIQKTFTFTPSDAGTYYLAFHDLNPDQTGFWIAIDDIIITDEAGDPCDEIANLIVANLTVEYAENCGTATITWDEVGAFIEYNIYRDGAKIAGPISATTYEDKSFDKFEKHTWSVAIVCFNGDEGTLVDEEKDACDEISIMNHEMKFSIFPNPANNDITIESNTIFSKVEIVNFLGQTVYSQNNNGETTKIDVSNLNGGIYFVRIISETATSVQKFVKK